MSYKVYGMNTLDSAALPRAIDGFIFFHSMESRSRNILEYLNEKDRLPHEVLSIVLENCREDQDSFGDSKNDTEFIQTSVSSDLSGTMIPCLKAIHNYILTRNKIGIDISAMPTPIFAQILHFMYEKHKEKSVIVYYSEPEHYNLDNMFDFSSCDGEIDIKAIPGFEGRTAQINDSQRMIFYIMGFDMNYLNRLIPQQINPDGIVPINGFPAYFPKYKDISLINNEVNYHEMDIQVVFAAANNPFETYNQISNLQKKYANYCIDIIPAGSKPMALGACLFALKNEQNDIRILFPFPMEYKSQATVGKGKIWEYCILGGENEDH